jgi:hypothetical protein
MPSLLNTEGRGAGGLTRRGFLHLGAGAVGLSLAEAALLDAADRAGARSCILLFLVGGPSQLDTWDPKPAAPDDVRGPFRPIRTSVPGIHVSEIFPRLAAVADRFAIVRSVSHAEAPIHETGQQLMQTGRAFRDGQEFPHYGAALSYLRRASGGGVPAFVVLPGRIGNTGVSISHGQGAGFLGSKHEPCYLGGTPDSGAFDLAREEDECLGRTECHSVLPREPSTLAAALAAEPDGLQSAYGRNRFGRACLLARRLVEQGVRCATVNMFETVFGEITWDCHAAGSSLPATLNDYKGTLGPTFDLAYTALLEDLHQRGLLETTLVVAMAEFGRTPRLNAGGGRDHWPGVWSVLFAGGGVRGGQVVGASDRMASEPADRPVSPAEIAASVYRALGVPQGAALPGPDGRPVPLGLAPPVEELFRG